MRLVRLLPERWQKLINEALKFGIVGGVNMVVNYAVFNILALTIFVTGQLKANVVATVVATISSYLMNRHWTYQDRPKSAMRREYALFFLFNAAGLVIELGVLGLAKYGFGITNLLALNAAKAIGVLIGTVFRFWTYRTFVFRPAPAATSTTPTAAPATPTAAPATSTAAPTTSTNTRATSTNASSPSAEPGGEGLTPLEAELAGPLDVTLEAELAVELDGVNRVRGGVPAQGGQA